MMDLVIRSLTSSYDQSRSPGELPAAAAPHVASALLRVATPRVAGASLRVATPRVATGLPRVAIATVAIITASLRIAAAMAAATTLLGGSARAAAQNAVVVSSKLSSESVMIGQMIKKRLDAAGIKTVDRTQLGATAVVRKALTSGEIDLYVEYTGNAGFFFNRADDPAWKDLRQGYELGSRIDYEANKIVWLTPANASNSWAIAVRKDLALASRLKTMTDFGHWVAAGNRVVLACSAEFANAGTLRALEKTYGFTMRSDQLIVLAGGETSAFVAAAAAGTNGVNTAMVYGTDGAVAMANLEIMDDDKHAQPIYAPVPMVREPVLKANPQIAELVKPLMESFTREQLQQLNARVQINGESIESVADDYLKSKGLAK